MTSVLKLKFNSLNLHTDPQHRKLLAHQCQQAAEAWQVSLCAGAVPACSESFLLVRPNLSCLFFLATDSLNARLVRQPASVFESDGSAIVKQSIVSVSSSTALRQFKMLSISP